MWFTIFLLIAFSLFLLPLLPGLMEFRRATDIQPLQVIQEYDTEITHFAVGFKTWLRKNFTTFFATEDQYVAENSEGTLEDSSAFQIVGYAGIPSYSREEIYNTATHKLIISNSPLRLTEKMFFEREVYSSSWIQAAGHSQFRALLAEGDIRLGEGCTVLRWVHSHQSLYASAGCQLFGRTSADECITLAEHCNFERLNAHMIMFGETFPPVEYNTIQLETLRSLPNVKDTYKRRSRINGGLSISARHYFDGDIVVTKNVHIGAGSHIKGNIKSNQDMHLAAGVRIDGSIVSAGSIHMEAGCRVTGPVIAEDAILIREGCVIGADATPTTITAPKIFITSGVMAYGTVWATETASVLTAPRGTT